MIEQFDFTKSVGWQPNPEQTERICAALPFGGMLASAAPGMIYDGKDTDLMPYLAYYEVSMSHPDGQIWMTREGEPPYKAQTGNNCTAAGLQRVVDLLQAMDLVDPLPGITHQVVPERISVETSYAFGLSEANMRGDNGCFGSAMAKGVKEIGAVPIRIVGEPYDETRARLVEFANDPHAVVIHYKDQAQAFRIAEIIRITSWDQLCGWIANRGLVTVASNQGFETERDARGIMEPAGSWMHQMCIVGIIRSDGVETALILQSWGPGNPNGKGKNPKYIDGPQPFQIPSFSFRARRPVVERMIAQGDTWGFRSFPGFARVPLPAKWTYGTFGG